MKSENGIVNLVYHPLFAEKMPLYVRLAFVTQRCITVRARGDHGGQRAGCGTKRHSVRHAHTFGKLAADWRSRARVCLDQKLNQLVVQIESHSDCTMELPLKLLRFRFDFTNANLNDDNAEKMDQTRIPELVCISHTMMIDAVSLHQCRFW